MGNLVQLYSAALNGLKAIPVEVETNASKGIKTTLVGLPDNAVKESIDRISAALQNTVGMPTGRKYTINMAPADIRKEGTAYDLPLAISILAASGELQCAELRQFMMVGELGLDGSLRPSTVHYP